MTFGQQTSRGGSGPVPSTAGNVGGGHSRSGKSASGGIGDSGSSATAAAAAAAQEEEEEVEEAEATAAAASAAASAITDAQLDSLEYEAATALDWMCIKGGSKIAGAVAANQPLLDGALDTDGVA